MGTFLTKSKDKKKKILVLILRRGKSEIIEMKEWDLAANSHSL